MAKKKWYQVVLRQDKYCVVYWSKKKVKKGKNVVIEDDIGLEGSWVVEDVYKREKPGHQSWKVRGLK